MDNDDGIRPPSEHKSDSNDGKEPVRNDNTTKHCHEFEIDQYTNQDGKSLHIAPMLRVSTTEFRNFFRLLTKRAILWTEMVVDETIAFTCHDADSLKTHLHREETEYPVICQIGGIDAKYTATATTFVEQFGYSQIDLNMDCPSNKVSGRNFGAILMKDLDAAVEILKTMHANVEKIPISVKCRIGIDEYDSWEFLVETITKLSTVCKRFTLHARKCLLKGLSPKENRLVPPLNYPRVYAICERFPDCQFWINGGIPGLKVAKQILYGVSPAIRQEQKHEVLCSICNVPNGSCTAPPTGNPPPNLKGCMLGRAAMDHPAQFWDVDRFWFGCDTNPCRNRRQVLEQYCHYLERTYPRRCCDSDPRMTTGIPSPANIQLERPYCSVCQPEEKQDEKEEKENDVPTFGATTATIKITSAVMDRSFKPVLGLFFGLPGSKVFRRACDVNSRDKTMRNCGPAFCLRKALHAMPDELLDLDFVRTEDLDDQDIPVHVSPSTSCCQ